MSDQASTSESARERPRSLAAGIDGAVRHGWRLLTSPRTLLVTLCALLTFVLVGALIPQSNGAASGASALVAWLAELRTRAPALADAIESSGATQLYSSFLFRVLLGWIAGLCVANLCALLIRERVRRVGDVRTWIGALPGDAAEGWRRLSEALAAAGLQRPIPVQAGDGQVAGVRRAGPRGWAHGLAYVGALALLGASLVAWRWGWRSADVTLLLGEAQSLGAEAGLSARLDEIRILPQAAGAPPRVESLVTLTGLEARTSVTLDAGHRARSDGWSLYQVESGPAVRLEVRDGQGQALDIMDTVGQGQRTPVVRIALRGSQQEQQFLAQTADLVINVVHYTSLPSQGIAGTALQVQAVRWSDGTVLLDELLDADRQLTVPALGSAGTLRLDVGFERYVVLRAEREPELPLALVGAVFMLLGLAAGLLWPPREAWVALRAGNARCDYRVDVPQSDIESAWVDTLRAALARQEGEAP